jgi:hypothetical protein
MNGGKDRLLGAQATKLRESEKEQIDETPNCSSIPHWSMVLAEEELCPDGVAAR